MKESFYDVLSNIDVKDRIKQKNGLNYLSWMWAWHELKKRYPLSYATVHETVQSIFLSWTSRISLCRMRILIPCR